MDQSLSFLLPSAKARDRVCESLRRCALAAFDSAIFIFPLVLILQPLYYFDIVKLSVFKCFLPKYIILLLAYFRNDIVLKFNRVASKIYVAVSTQTECII